MRCALIENTTSNVVNVIIADPSVDPAPEGHTIIGIPDDSPVSIGWVYDGTDFVDPNPPVVEEPVQPTE